MPLLWDTTFTVHKMLDISVFRHFHSPSVVGRTSLGSCHKISWRESGFIEVWKSSKQLPARTAEINPVKIQYTISRYQLWRHAPLTKMQSTGDKWEVWAVLVSLKELLLRIHTVSYGSKWIVKTGNSALTHFVAFMLYNLSGRFFSRAVHSCARTLGGRSCLQQ